MSKKNINQRFTVFAVLAAMTLFIVYSLPNIWGEYPSLVVSSNTDESIKRYQKNIIQILEKNQIPFIDVRLDDSEKEIIISFNSINHQIFARDMLKAQYQDRFTFSLSLLSASPTVFSLINAKQMNLGLDLRGGIHLLMRVNSNEIVKQYVQSIIEEAKQIISDNKANLLNVSYSFNPTVITFELEDQDQANLVWNRLSQSFFNELTLESSSSTESKATLIFSITPDALATVKKSTIEKNTNALRKRIDELGVNEPLIQRQGLDRILVQLPGVQDIVRAKKILGSTASLDFRLLSDNSRSGLFFNDRNGQQIALLPQVIVSGESIVDAIATRDSTNGQQIVSVRLDGRGASRMEKITSKNIGKPMAVVFKEQGFSGKTKSTVVSVATIRDVLSNRFQISGLTKEEAQDLALFLRSGSLKAPMEIIEEKTIGPSLGKKNIDQGMLSFLIGSLAIVLFMIIYYRGFGVIASASLLANFMMLIAIMSAFGATLTLPGIAGILLNIGMAVDSNILINERIKEELSQKRNFQDSIYFGYNKVLITILDSNVTTLLAVLFLFILGSGPVRGFAVTISIGAITTVFCAVSVSRLLVNSLYSKYSTIPKWAL